jgi:hypothetical protein
MVDLSSSLDEEGSIADTSRDLEFTKRLYGELNRALLGPPSDRKIIILSDSDEEKEEVHEEKSSGVGDVTTPAAINPASMIIVMIRDPTWRLAVRTVAEMTPVSLRLPCR